MKSPLKWVGSKNRIMPTLATYLPTGSRLVEPFAGSCSVMMNTEYSGYVLGDSNPDLINFINQAKGNVETLIEYSKYLFDTKNSSADYYHVRSDFNAAKKQDVEKAAMFLYLNRYGYNGLCRYNKKGEYNVPYGKRVNAYFPGEELIAMSDRLRGCIVMEADWLTTLQQVRPGDVVYIDPPYIPISKTANFSDYTKEGFGMADQIKLRDALLDLAQYGIKIIVSNSFTNDTFELYKDFDIHRIFAARSVGGEHNVKEVIATINC